MNANTSKVSGCGKVGRIKYIELVVSDICKSKTLFEQTLGFNTLSEWPCDVPRQYYPQSVIVRHGDIRIVLTAAAKRGDAVDRYIEAHGDGVRDIALAVTGIDNLFKKAMELGGKPLVAPSDQATVDEKNIRTACVGVFGDVVHTLIEEYSNADARSATTANYHGASNERFSKIDHVAIALERGQLTRWAAFYCNAFGFEEVHSEYVATDYSAMQSKVVRGIEKTTCLSLMEPADGRHASQIQRFVNNNGGAGVQHIALLTGDIVEAVSITKSLGLEFLITPQSYYSVIEERVGKIDCSIELLRQHGILVDRESDGILLQIFTKAVTDRATLFLELIERHGAVGFGSGNIRALFEAVERTAR